MQSGRKHRPRFYCPDLMAGAITAGDEANVATTITLSPPQAHHLLVLRKKLGDEVVLFNQQAGAWQGNIIAMDKKSARVVLGQCLQSPPARAVPAPILAFCLLEKSRLDILLPKAIELGVGEMIAIKSDFTERKKEEWDNALEKWRRVSLAAVEQSERLAAPIIHPAMALTDINTWLTARRADDQLSDDIQIFYGDERRHAPPFLAMLASMGHHSSPKKNPTAIHRPPPAVMLVGPPAGFSLGEHEWLQQQKNIHGVHLGDNILRSETAALAMLAGWLFFYHADS